MATIQFVCSNNVCLPPIIVKCAGKIEEFISQLHSTYERESNFIRKRALAFGSYMQRYAGKLDKGRPSTYLKARKNSEISVILIMRQLLHEIRFSKCNSDVNKVASKIDGSKLEQTLKDINKSANRGNKRNTWFCKISNIYWNALKHQKMLRNLLSNYNGPTTFFFLLLHLILKKRCI